ncbi:MAG: esterase-like activity of phytase family protein [Pseudomonadota bacterium]
MIFPVMHLGWLLLVLLGTARAEPITLDVQSVPFHDAASGTPAAGVRLLGMLELPAVSRDGLKLSQLSGLAWDDDDGILYAISDKGVLFHLRPVFHNGSLTGLTLLRAVALRDASTQKAIRGRLSDSEGLDILNGRNGQRGDAVLLVSFERMPRIVRYRPDGTPLGELPLPKALKDPGDYRGGNRMLESVCHDPALGVLTAPELPLAGRPGAEGTLYALDGREWRYRRASSDARLVAMECLGQGRVLLLENRFGRLTGTTHVYLRRLNLPAKPGAEPVEEELLTVFDRAHGYQLDNFEGLARHRGNRFFLVSDNNDLFVQRTLLLYLEIGEQRRPK